MCDYWKDVWALVVSAEWMANTGLPLLSTVLGLVIAYWFVRKQLRSDRALRHADHKREAATRLGSALIQTSRRLKATGTDSPWWQAPSWSDSAHIGEAIGEARGILPNELLDSLQGVASAIEDMWLACYVSAKTHKPDTRFHAIAMQRVLAPRSDSLESIGVDLRAWDGEVDLPSGKSPLGDSPLSAAQQNEERKALYSRTWGQYASELDKLRGVNGVSLAKPSGARFGD